MFKLVATLDATKVACLLGLGFAVAMGGLVVTQLLPLLELVK